MKAKLKKTARWVWENGPALFILLPLFYFGVLGFYHIGQPHRRAEGGAQLGACVAYATALFYFLCDQIKNKTIRLLQKWSDDLLARNCQLIAQRKADGEEWKEL